MISFFDLSPLQASSVNSTLKPFAFQNANAAAGSVRSYRRNFFFHVSSSMFHFLRYSSGGRRRANQSAPCHMRWNHAPASRMAREVSAARVLNQ